MPENVLFTFTSFHDPYRKSAVAGEEQPGPILTALAARKFDRVVLFSTPRTIEMTHATLDAISCSMPAVKVVETLLPIDDPTDYVLILSNLRRECGKFCEKFPDSHLFILTTPGTPQMHACWLLLAASGEIPARLVHTREAKFASAEKPSFYIVDLAGTPFPRILPVSVAKPQAAAPADKSRADLATIQEEIGLYGEHPEFQRALQRASACAEFSAPVLLTGETGTGKDLFSRLIHRMSDRKLRPLVVVNCAAIPETLVESTLFGHKKGAFTGANEDLKGKFEQAHTGTLFLDEIGELPLEAQAKLLRVLEDGLIEPLGKEQPVKVDVRVIAATNRNLREEIKAKRFREDLYYRLNNVEVTPPPLRERRSDIPRVAILLLQTINKTMRRQRQLSPEALVVLQSKDWPGNVRELKSVLQRSVILSGEKEILRPEDLQFDVPTAENDAGHPLPDPHLGFDLTEFLANARSKLIDRALELSGNNQSQAAKLLGISPQAVSSSLKSQGQKA
ncbi:MAG TPA: RNA repair transcriptional activator RtcR family protein [Candidatus Angelobacter sp.]|nr:RNA repair transcriptional activator RtcR family protein [Candidatus Angelobacter sp.]